MDTVEQVEANLARLTVDSELFDRHQSFIDCLEIALAREHECSGNLQLYVEFILKMAKGTNSPFRPSSSSRAYDFKKAKKQLPVLEPAPAPLSQTVSLHLDDVRKTLVRTPSSTSLPDKILEKPFMKKEF